MLTSRQVRTISYTHNRKRLLYQSMLPKRVGAQSTTETGAPRGLRVPEGSLGEGVFPDFASMIQL